MHLHRQIRKIACPERNEKEDYISKLKRTSLGRLYTTRLKHIAFIKMLWRRFFKFQNLAHQYFYRSSLYYKLMKYRWYPYIKQNEFVQRNEVHVFTLSDETVVETPKPKIFPRRYQEWIIQPHTYYRFPEIYGSVIRNGIVCGGTNTAIAGNVIVCHDLYDFEREYTSEEFHFRTRINPKHKKMFIQQQLESSNHVSEAVSFVDALSFNYAHWLTEVLPKIALFCADQRFKDVPIIVDDLLHDNIMESLFCVAGQEREIICLPTGVNLHCDKLYLISSTGYVPFEWRGRKHPDCSHGIFSPKAFNCLLNHLKPTKKAFSKGVYPKKIYLRRNSNIRNLSNAKEVEKLFKSHGYMVVEPEKLTFSQQVALFSNAKYIAGASGAAFANLIFAPQDSKITILISKHPDTIYWYWQNIACACGNSINYIFGSISDP